MLIDRRSLLRTLPAALVPAAAAIAAIATLWTTASAQEMGMVNVAASATPGTVARGSKGTMTVTLTLKPGWHVYAADPGDSSYIPTTVSASADAVTFARPAFPKAKSLKTSASPKPLNVYAGAAKIMVPFTVAKTAKPGKKMLKATVGYQTCNDTMCLPPTTTAVSAAVLVK